MPTSRSPMIALLTFLTIVLGGCFNAPTDSNSTEDDDPTESEQALDEDPDEMSASMSIDWRAVSEHPIDDDNADAWARIGGDDDEKLRIYVADKSIDGVCDEEEAIGRSGMELRQGQVALRFDSFDGFSDEESKAFTGQPATFEDMTFTAFYYSSLLNNGTHNSSSPSQDRFPMKMEITQVTDDFVVGSARVALDRSGEVSTEFTAVLCDE